MDWKKALPFLGTLVTGNVPGMIATAASALSEALGYDVPASPDAIDNAVKNATPEQMAALKKIDSDLKIRFRELDTEDRKIAADLDKSAILDTAHARTTFVQSTGVLVMGFGINLASYVLCAMVLYGCYTLINGAKLNIDPGMAAVIGTLVGGVVQWVMASAQQSNSFFFGSSPSARQTSAQLAQAVANAAPAAAKKT